MQSYDFLELHRRIGCSLQVGGSDQWGNIVSGVDLVRRVTGHTVHGLTWPLLQTSSGAKMGKSAQGAVWLDENLCSPYQYWQFWRNVEDRDVMRFLRFYTMVPLEVLSRFSSLQGEELREAKIFLADEATAFLHGSTCLPDIHRAVQAFSQEGSLTDSLGDTVPVFVLSADQMQSGVLLLDVLQALAFVSSRREGRQKIREAAVRLEGEVVNDELFNLIASLFQGKEEVRISLGSKNHGIIRKYDGFA